MQAARSGAQNIAEGSQASGTSKKMELKLTNVARASLEELRLDYEDFLRQRGLPIWPRQDPRRADLIARRPGSADAVAEWVGEIRNGPRGLHGRHGPAPSPASSTTSIASTSSTPSYPEIAANAALALIAVACSLFDRQLAAQAAAFEQDGGFTERLYQRRQSKRRGA